MVRDVDNVGEALERLGFRIADVIAEMLIFRQLEQGLSDEFGGGGSGGGGGFFSGIGDFFSNLFHDGGIVGSSGHPRRRVSPALFLGAPRLHDGLMPNEFPAILERGEAVIPRDVMEGIGGAGAAAGDIIMNINIDASGNGDDVEPRIEAAVRRAVDLSIPAVKEEARRGRMRGLGFS